MTLKNARLARAENLPEEIQRQLGRNTGLIIIETKNPDLREEFTAIKEGGIREYLMSLGRFQDTPLSD